MFVDYKFNIINTDIQKKSSSLVGEQLVTIADHRLCMYS